MCVSVCRAEQWEWEKGSDGEEVREGAWRRASQRWCVRWPLRFDKLTAETQGGEYIPSEGQSMSKGKEARNPRPRSTPARRPRDTGFLAEVPDGHLSTLWFPLKRTTCPQVPWVRLPPSHSTTTEDCDRGGPGEQPRDMTRPQSPTQV